MTGGDRWAVEAARFGVRSFLRVAIAGTVGALRWPNVSAWGDGAWLWEGGHLMMMWRRPRVVGWSEPQHVPTVPAPGARPALALLCPRCKRAGVPPRVLYRAGDGVVCVRCARLRCTGRVLRVMSPTGAGPDLAMFGWVKDSPPEKWEVRAWKRGYGPRIRIALPSMLTLEPNNKRVLPP